MKFLDAEFVKGFIRMANDGWEQGWHERNGGNLSYRVKPEEVDYVNAHGTSTHHNDLFETRAIRRALGDAADQVKVSSTKSMIGHLLGAAGAVELIACVKSIEEGYIHPTVGTTEPDEGCDLDYVINGALHQDVKVAMSNSLGFGGHNVCVALRKIY